MSADVSEASPKLGKRGGLRDAALIVLFAALLIVPSFFTRDLWNPDEPRYMEVAREMALRGDYLVPHLDNVYYAEKPPMFFWLTAGLYRLGAGNISGRIVAGLAMIGTLLLIHAFGRRRFGGRAGLLAALITATSLLFVGLLKTGVIDPLLMFFATAAVLAGYCALTGRTPRSRLWWLAFYAACGLAMLTKGPVGFAVPFLVLLVFALFQRKSVSFALRQSCEGKGTGAFSKRPEKEPVPECPPRKTDAVLSFGGWIHAAGVALMLLIFCAWLLPAMARGGHEYSQAILGKPVSYTNSEANHAHGPHYYFLQLPVLLLPWTFLFVPALAQAVRDWRRSGDRDAAFLSLWFLSILALFTAVTAKRERYLMPLMPAAGLLCARYWMAAAREGVPWPRLHHRLSAALYVLLALTGLCLGIAPFIGQSAATWVLESRDPEALSTALEVLDKPSMMLLVPLGAFVLAVALIGLTAARRRRGWLLGSALAVVLLISLFVDLALVPAINPVKSSKLFCARILPYLQEADEKYLLAHSYSGVINLYTGELDIPILRPSASLPKIGPRDGKKEERSAAMVAALTEVFGRSGKIVVVTDEKQSEAFLEALPPHVRIAAHERVGHRGMICLANFETEAAASPRRR